MSSIQHIPRSYRLPTSSSFIEENHIYKLQSKMAQQAQPSQPGVPSQDLMSYWGTFKPPWNPPTIGLISSSGYKFEILSVLPDQWDSTSREYIENREVLVVNNHAQYCSVVKTGIGKAKMIIGGEVDASELTLIVITL